LRFKEAVGITNFPKQDAPRRHDALAISIKFLIVWELIKYFPLYYTRFERDVRIKGFTITGIIGAL
jgi:hypothetical protein